MINVSSKRIGNRIILRDMNGDFAGETAFTYNDKREYCTADFYDHKCILKKWHDGNHQCFCGQEFDNKESTN